MSFADIPSRASLKPKPFRAHVSDQNLSDFKQLLKLSKIGPVTYENQVTDPEDFLGWGIKRDWLVEAKKRWETGYDWRKTEDRINSHPNFTAQIENDGFTNEVHFMALFSKKADAVPLLLLHGWPGSFLEFLSSVEVLKEKYTPDNLPFHVIVPSLPGYGYSNGPSTEKDSTVESIADVMDKLMIGLGFGDGYISQGGDVGSFVTRVLGATKPSCKAVHWKSSPILHMCVAMPPSEDAVEKLSEEEKAGWKRFEDFGNLGNAYAREHGSRPSTIGLVLSSSPIAQLAWIGEKFVSWSDEDPPIDEILDSVTLYWFTESFARAIFPYRQFFGPKPTLFHYEPEYHIKKPMGYTWHPKELAPIPQSFAATTGNLVWFRAQKEGGHFAAMEKPKLFIKDMEDFVAEVWPKAK